VERVAVLADEWQICTRCGQVLNRQFRHPAHGRLDKTLANMLS
jgi:hypothetical protein